MQDSLATARRLIPQGARFAVIGASSTAITVVVFNLLTHVGDDPVLSGLPIVGYTLGMIAGTSVSFVGNRWWVFHASGSSDWRRDLVVFIVINLVGTLIPSACLAVSRYGFGLHSALADNVAANGVGLTLATVFRFLAYKNVVFSHSSAPTAVGVSK